MFMTKIILILLILFSTSLFSQTISIVSPKDNIVVSDTLVEFKWNSVDDAVFYQLQIANDTTFNSIVKDSTNHLLNYLDIGLNYGSYYWRVRYYSDTGYSNWNIDSFIVFSPSAVNSLKAWYSIDYGINKDSLNRISIWQDKSGNGNNLLQSDTLYQPTLNKSNITNDTIVSFDGGKQALKTNLFTLEQPYIVFILFDNKENLPINQYLFDGNTVNTGRFRIYLNTFECYSGNFFSSQTNSVNLNYNLSTLIFNQNNSIIRNNKDELCSGNVGNNNPNGFTLGSYGLINDNPSVHAEFDCKEIIICDTLIDSVNIDLIEKYLTDKYASPACLGLDIYANFCDTTIDAGARFTDYLWNTGDTTQTITVNQSGQYSVTVTDIFGYPSTDTIMIYFPEVGQLTDSTICYGDTISWNTGLNHYYTFIWQDASTDSLIPISDAGDYYVQITDTFGCVYQSDTAHISVDDYPITTSLGADKQLCAGQSLFLETGAAETVYYLWNTGTTEDHIVIESAGDYSLIATNNLGCVAKDTINIQIQGYAPIPGFYTQEQCFGDLTQFTDTSQGQGGATIVSWDWGFGDLSNSNLQNPMHTYADTGTYQVTLHLMTNDGCENTLLKDVRIYSNPKAQFYTNQLCQNYLVNFVNTSTSAMSAIDYNRWDFGNNDTTNEVSTQHVFSSEGNANVQLKVRTIDGCEDVLDTTVLIKPSPIANFSYSALCVGSNIHFYDQTVPSGVLSIINWNWETSNGDISSLENPSFNFPNSEYVNISLEAKSVNGCSDTISKNLWIYENPTADFNVEDACDGNALQVENFSYDNQSSVSNYYWWINNTLISQLETPDYTINGAGLQKIMLKIISQSACQDTLTQFFRSYPLPNSQFSVSDNYTTPNRPVQFIAEDNLVTNQYTYKFGDGHEQYLAETNYAYADSGYYEPKLIVVNSNQCSDSTTQSIRVVQPLLDLDISDLKTFDYNGKTKISFLISNIGNLKIDSIDFRIELSGQTVIEEHYSEPLNIGEYRKVTLNTQFLFSTTKSHYLCLTAFVNGIYDDINTENNIDCISKNIDDKLLKIYPNPVKDQLTLMYKSAYDNTLTYEINDALGKSISTGILIVKKDVHKYVIDIAQMASGVYSIKIDGAIAKFIKE